MLKNNNSYVITKMAKKNIRNNKLKNGIMILAVILSVFLIFTILTVGETWFRMQKVQNIRLQGADYDVCIYGGFTEEQKEICENNPDIAVTGAEGWAGIGIKTEYDNTLNSIFLWVDDNVWDKMKQPAIKSVKGKYPEKENEVMATKEALKDCGMENLGVGDSFVITYSDNMGEHTKEFAISGICEEYVNRKTFYVTKSFFEQSGYTLEDYGRGFLYIKFKSPIVTDKIKDALEKRLNLNSKQSLIFGADTGGSVGILIGISGLIIITCLSSYLLIYNIMYLSVSGNVRCYGLLQTIGMTKRQVKQLVKKQLLLVGSAGIGIGIISGLLISFGLVPAVVKIFGVRQDNIEIRFNPLVFAISILLAAATIYFAGRKPIRMAVKVSPVEALRYSSLSGGRKTTKTGRGNIILRMALGQLRKDKKKTVVAIMALGISLSVFICIVTIVLSHGPRTIASNYMDYDLLLKNDTMQMSEESSWKPVIDETIMAKLKHNKSISQIHPITNAEIVIPWEDKFMEKWMESFYDRWMYESYNDIKEDYIEHPEKYYSFLTGIDETEFKYLNSSLGQKVDENEFLKGKCCILFLNGLSPEYDIIGNDISFYAYGNENDMHNITVKGVTDDSYYANLLGITPTLIVSDNYVKQIVKKPFVSKVNLQYKEEYDENAEKDILQMLNGSKYSKDFSYESKIEELHRVTKSQGNMMGIGISITLIIAFIGLINYMNTSIGSINSRLTEFSVMESIGMTQKQLRKMLVTEGLVYTAGSVFMAMTAGLFVTYNIYELMNYRHIDFAIPIIPIAAAIALIVIICSIIPLITHWNLTRKSSIVERIRKFE